MSLVYTENISRMDDFHRIKIPEYLCATLNYEAGAPFEFYADTHKKAVVIRPYDPNTKRLYHENKHNAKVWLESQVETFSMFGYGLDFFLPDGQSAISDSSAPIPTKDDMEKTFKLWKKWNMARSYKKNKGEEWCLYPIVDEEKVILWVAYVEPLYADNCAIYCLADAYLEKFVR